MHCVLTLSVPGYRARQWESRICPPSSSGYCYCWPALCAAVTSSSALRTRDSAKHATLGDRRNSFKIHCIGGDNESCFWPMSPLTEFITWHLLPSLTPCKLIILILSDLRDMEFHGSLWPNISCDSCLSLCILITLATYIVFSMFIIKHSVVELALYLFSSVGWLLLLTQLNFTTTWTEYVGFMTTYIIFFHIS